MSVGGVPSVFLIILAVLVAVLAFGGFAYCSSDRGGGDDFISFEEMEPLVITPVPRPLELSGTPVMMPAMTHEAGELQRLIEEHQRLLTSIPPSPGPTSTPSSEQLSVSVGLEVMENPDGIPVTPGGLDDWFSPGDGIVFYRAEGGDWTHRETRENSPFAQLLYYEGYPEGIRTLENGGLLQDLARELAFGVSEIFPPLGSPSEFLVAEFGRNLGWELVEDGGAPYLKVWTTFRFRNQDVVEVYAAGGVAGLSVYSAFLVEDDPDSRFEYLRVGEFVGPVVLELVGHGS